MAIERLATASDIELPRRATDGAAGMDLVAAVDAGGSVRLAPGERALIPTGIRIALPRGLEGQIRPRSGLAWRNGVSVLNAPGTIDSDYRGEIKVVIANLGRDDFVVERGMRIAQLVVAPVLDVTWIEQPVDSQDSARGSGGFGSTGSHAKSK